MNTSSADLSELNARRRRAVQLRVDGRTLAQIRQETGLSVPTIIDAYQAFTGGGWSAIDVGSRGRPRGEGRVLPLTQERGLRDAVFLSLPEQHGFGPTLWSASLLAELARRQAGAALPPRALSRLMERWGLGLQPLRDAAASRESDAAWVETHWVPALARCRAERSQLVWAAAMAHPDRRAPGGLVVAISPRGSLRWLPVKQLSASATYVEFLARLLRGEEPAASKQPARWTVYLHGPDLTRAPDVTTWLAGQPGLALLPCPVAPVVRRPAEPRPEAAPSEHDDTRESPADTVPQFPLPAPGADTRPRAQEPTRAAPVGAPVSSFPQPRTDHPMSLTHLQRLEAESIHIMREVVAEADNPVMLYSIGKDSAVMLHLAKKAFFPSPPPFPLLHVDTTWKFRAMYEMRERMAKEMGMELLVYQNPEAKELGINPFDHGSQIHTDMWKTQGLKQALDKYNFDVAFGGARRDEEKSRAKERIFSFRSAQHRWDPKNQRPELWRLYNGRKQKGESIRCFPISNWTELDIWQYIYLENVPIVPLYFSAERPVVDRDGTLIMVDDDRFPLKNGEVPMMKKVRFRTLGCYPLSGAVESEADTLPSIIQEMLLTKTSERQGRMIDHDAAASMEKKKQEGYF